MRRCVVGFDGRSRSSPMSVHAVLRALPLHAHDRLAVVLVVQQRAAGSVRCVPPSLSTLLVLTCPCTVLYRSKDGRLPDFSADKEPGEVFFDVRLSAILSCMYIASPF